MQDLWMGGGGALDPPLVYCLGWIGTVGKLALPIPPQNLRPRCAPAWTSGFIATKAAHMAFIATKAGTNNYVTEALIKYKAAVSKKVVVGQLSDWVAADAESVAVFLGVDATHAIQGTGTGSRSFSSAKSDSANTDYQRCYFKNCCRSHLCGLCKASDHTAKP